MGSFYFPLLFAFLNFSCSQPKNTEQEVKDEINAFQNKLVTDTTITTEIIYRSTDKGKTWKSFANGIPKEATVNSFLSIKNKIYAATEYHGIFVNREGDSSWLPIGNGLPENSDINAIAVVNNVFIIGTFKNGIFISTDSCLNWKQSIVPINHTPIRCLLTYRNKIFAGADDGIYESMDNGNTWKQVYKGVQINGFTELNNKIYAGVMNGAIMTNDEGLNWGYIYQPHTLHDIANDGESIYAMTLGGGLLKSKNDGVTWENINNGLGTLNLYTFEVKNINSELFAAQWHGIYRSDNGGRSWQLIRNGLPDSTAFTTLEITGSGLIAGIGLRKK